MRSIAPDVKEEARRVLKPWEPCNRTYPKWLVPAIKSAVKNGRLEPGKIVDACTAVNHALNCLGRDWADHLRVVERDGREILVSYPYAERINGRSIQQLEDFCGALGLHYRVCANAHYYPGRTIAIHISPEADIPSNWPPA